MHRPSFPFSAAHISGLFVALFGAHSLSTLLGSVSSIELTHGCEMSDADARCTANGRGERRARSAERNAAAAEQEQQWPESSNMRTRDFFPFSPMVHTYKSLSIPSNFGRAADGWARKERCYRGSAPNNGRRQTESGSRTKSAGGKTPWKSMQRRRKKGN